MALGKVRNLASLEGEVSEIEDNRVLWDALDQVGQKGVVEGLPQGIDTQLGSQWGGVDVSGGQWQRLTLARALAAQAPVLILDEPTSNVDSQSEEEILRNLVRHKQGRITILVTHRAWTLKSADVIYVFEAGRIVDQGTYESLCEHSKVFQDLFELQIKAGRGPDDADACSDEAGMKGLPSV